MTKQNNRLKKKMWARGVWREKIFAEEKMLEHNGFCAQAKPQTD